MMALCAMSVSAQGIEFMPEGSLLQAAVDKAKAENKLVFLDCYTSWCGPCRMMATKIFPTQEVGDFMNPKYVSIKIDMEKGEGPAVAERLQVSAFPTFVILNGEGAEVGRFVGGSDAKGFMERVEKNSVNDGSASLDARFNAGERDPKFLLDYIEYLNGVYRRQQCNVVAEILLDGKAETFASDTTLMKVFMNHLSNPYNPAFIYAAKHPEEMAAQVGREKYDNRIHSVLYRYSNSTLKKDGNGGLVLDSKKLDDFYSLMKECNIAKASHYKHDVLLRYAESKEDWQSYIASMEEYAGADMLDWVMCTKARVLIDKCQDKTVLDRLKALLQTRYDALSSGGRQPQEVKGRRASDVTPQQRLEEYIKILNGENVKPA